MICRSSAFFAISPLCVNRFWLYLRFSTQNFIRKPFTMVRRVRGPGDLVLKRISTDDYFFSYSFWLFHKIQKLCLRFWIYTEVGFAVSHLAAVHIAYKVEKPEFLIIPIMEIHGRKGTVKVWIIRFYHINTHPIPEIQRQFRPTKLNLT